MLLVNAILLYILRNGTQGSLSSTADQPLIPQRHFCILTYQNLHLATETEQDRTRLPVFHY
jgi:hypothetical protein